MDNRYETELVLKTEGFKRALNNASKEADNFNKKVQKSFSITPMGGKISAGVGSDFSRAFNEATRLSNIDWSNVRSQTLSLNDATKETAQEVTNLADNTEEATKNVESMGKSSKNAGIQISSSFKDGIKSIKRLTIGFLGARSVFSLFRQQLNAYRGENEQFNESMTLTTNIFTQTLAPAFEWFGNVLQYAMIGLAKVLEIMFGVNILSKVTAKSIKGTSDATKELNDNLTGLDEITNLQKEGTGTGALGGISAQMSALEEFQKKMKEVQEWFDKHNGLTKTLKWIGDFVKQHPWATLLGIGAFSTLIKLLPTVLGISGGTTGLFGIKTALGLIAGMGAIAIIFNIGNIRDKINDIDWPALGALIGKKISDAITDIDWKEIGKTIANLVVGGFSISKGLFGGLFDGVWRSIEEGFGIEGESSAGKFLQSFRNVIKSMTSSGFDLVIPGLSKIKTGINLFGSLFRANGGIYNGGWHDIRAYAGGGLPSAGEMFIAREAGPEMVGTINGSTAVMNNDQIVASVSAGVAQAVASVMGSNDRPIVLNINGKEFARATYTDYQNESRRVSSNTSIRRY